MTLNATVTKFRELDSTIIEAINILLEQAQKSEHNQPIIAVSKTSR